MNLLGVYDSIAVEMEEVRELFDEQLHSDEPIVADMIEHIGKFRGKMLRPMLVLLSGRAWGPIRREHHVIAAVAEMVHMATLVHDDVLDEACHRRRGRTINALHGNEAAVVLGDLLISNAFGLCSSLDSQLASRLLAATTNTVCAGELMQLYYRGFYDLTEQRYLEIILRKTASLIATCCYLGAGASGATQSQCCAMEQYGRNLGIAFQIMDDITDIVGDEKTEGKTLRTDFVKEKVTLPIIHYLQNCSPGQVEHVQAILAEPEHRSCNDLARRLECAGSIDYARGVAAQFIAEAKGVLPAEAERQPIDTLIELAAMVAA